MSVQEALRIVADTHMFSIIAPKWVYKLPVKWLVDCYTYVLLSKLIAVADQDPGESHRP